MRAEEVSRAKCLVCVTVHKRADASIATSDWTQNTQYIAFWVLVYFDGLTCVSFCQVNDTVGRDCEC
jgi:hypothetical protein